MKVSKKQELEFIRNLHTAIVLGFATATPFAVTGQLRKCPNLNKAVFYSTLALVGFYLTGCPLTKMEHKLQGYDNGQFTQRMLKKRFGIDIEKETLTAIGVAQVIAIIGSYFYYKKIDETFKY